MAHIHTTIAIDASADAVWNVLGELTSTTEWLPGIVDARLEGSLRICRTIDGAEIHERISDYSAEARTYRYEHLRVPLPVRGSEGTFKVESSADGGAVVVLDARFEALDPAQEREIASMLEGALEQALDSLRRRVETGVAWRASAGQHVS